MSIEELNYYATPYLHPDLWPVKPQQWTEVTRKGQVKVAALMPMPNAVDNVPHCLDDEYFTSENRGAVDPLTRAYVESKCAECPVGKDVCAEWGTAHEVWGVWGGLFVQDRKQIRKERNQVLVPPQDTQLYGLGEGWNFLDAVATSAVRVLSNDDIPAPTFDELSSPLDL